MRKSALTLLFCSIITGCAIGPTGRFAGGGNGNRPLSCGVLCFTQEEAGKQVDLGSSVLPSEALAQSFSITTGLSANVTSVSLLLNAEGGTFSSRAGQFLSVSIYQDLGGSPGTLMPGMTGTIDLSTVGATPDIHTATFTNPLPLAAGTYWIVVTPSYAIPARTFVQWAGNDSPSTGYSGGMAKYRVSNGWSSAAIGMLRDLVFSLN